MTKKQRIKDYVATMESVRPLVAAGFNSAQRYRNALKASVAAWDELIAHRCAVHLGALPKDKKTDLELWDAVCERMGEARKLIEGNQ